MQVFNHSVRVASSQTDGTWVGEWHGKGMEAGAIATLLAVLQWQQEHPPLCPLAKARYEGCFGRQHAGGSFHQVRSNRRDEATNYGHHAPNHQILCK